METSSSSFANAHADALSAPENMECPICCEKYNNSRRAIIKCEYGSCNIEMCKTCMRTTLMGTPNDAHCFECKNPYTDNYLVNNLGRNWLTTIYKVHRREMLFQREGIAKLPDSMNAALLKINIKKEEDLVREARAKINELRHKIREMENKIRQEAEVKANAMADLRIKQEAERIKQEKEKAAQQLKLEKEKAAKQLKLNQEKAAKQLKLNQEKMAKQMKSDGVPHQAISKYTKLSIEEIEKL